MLGYIIVTLVNSKFDIDKESHKRDLKLIH